MLYHVFLFIIEQNPIVFIYSNLFSIHPLMGIWDAAMNIYNISFCVDKCFNFS